MTPFVQDADFTLYQGDAAKVLRSLPAESVDSIVTSPPYFQQRDYGGRNEIGSEKTLAAYVAALANVFDQAERVLKPSGTAWVNIGDKIVDGELVGAPWRFALEMKDRGWRLCMENVWTKETNRAEPLRRRSTLAHEQVFQFSLLRYYFYDAAAITEPTVIAERPQRKRAQMLFDAAGLTPEHLAAIRSVGIADTGKALATTTGAGRNDPEKQRLAGEAKAALGGYYREFLTGDRKNRRSVWTFDVEPLDEDHPAPFPPGLAERCILAGCPPDGTVLDPFLGSGTTALVARRLGRRCVGVELNESYCELAARRLSQQSLLAEPAA